MTERNSPRGVRGTYTRGNLPHFDHEALLQMITFRLADALPQSVVAEHPLDFAEMDAHLDRGHGSCLLRDAKVAGIVRGALHYFDSQRYDLGPWVIMPNHVHVLLRPLKGHGLGDIVHSWKSFTAKQINALVGSTGTLWQRDYFDRFVRNRRHLMTAIHYIHDNPVAAGLTLHAEDWPFSSARDASYVAALVGAGGRLKKQL